MKKRLFLTLFLTLTLAIGTVSAQEHTDEPFEPKNSDKIELDVQQQSWVDKIFGSMFAVDLRQTTVERGDQVEGTISGEVPAEVGQSGCDSDDVRLNINFFTPDGQYYAGQYKQLEISDCSTISVDYSFTVDSDVQSGDWTVEAFVEGPYGEGGQEYLGSDEYTVVDSTSGDDDYTEEPEENLEPADVDISGDSNIEVGETASFNADGDGEGSLTYEWFVDGSYETTGSRLSKQFEQEGNYDIRVEVEDSEGQTASDSTNINVDLEEPSANIQYSQKPSNVETGDNIVLDASTSQEGSYPISRYNWRIDGSIRSGTQVQYTPESTGQKNIELEVCDSRSNCDTTSKTISVSESFSKPNVVISVPRNAVIEETVQLDASQSNAEAGILSVEWRIAGQRYTGEQVEVQFQNTGSKSVTAIVKDQDGQTTRKETSINVTEEEPFFLVKIWNSVIGFFTK